MKRTRKPNVLIFTVAALNSTVGNDTCISLLKGYDTACVAHLCIRDERPDYPGCSRYFRISENKVLKSILNRSTQTGKEVFPHIRSEEDEADLLAHKARYKKMRTRRGAFMQLARELVWKFGCWKTPELDAFLDDFKPDVILHSMDGYIHFNRIVRYAIQRTKAKAVGYILDDNFTYQQHSDIGYKLYRFLQRRSLKSLAGMTDSFFAISKYTKKEADEFFGIDCKVLTKPLNGLPVPHQYQKKVPLRMIYTGNLLIGRDRSLVRLVTSMGRLNQGGIKLSLDVYTQTELPHEINRLLQTDYCRIHSPIPQAFVHQMQKEADILLFLEDLDGKDAKEARLSFSSKITDYLSCGKCILAIGHPDTAPMRYFVENDAALVCDSDEAISTNIEAVCEDCALLSRYAASASRAGLEMHHPQKICQSFQQTIQELFQPNDLSSSATLL